MVARGAALLLLLSSCAEEIVVIGPNQSAELTMEALGDGDDIALALLLSPGFARWSDQGRESVVLTVTVDGVYNQDIVVFGPQREYRIFTGPLRAGKHVVRLVHNGAKSPAALSSVTLFRWSYGSVREDPLVRYAPIIVGRNGGSRSQPLQAYNDAPVLAYALAEPAGRNTRYTFGMVWTNEDGGTGLSPAWLLSSAGRTADFEWVYEVEVDPNGTIAGEWYQGVLRGRYHERIAFRGRKSGAHPILKVSTSNNLLSDEVDSSITNIRTALVPVRWPVPGWDGGPREKLLDAHPWMYGIMNDELRREGKMEPVATPWWPQPSDLRNYVFFDVEAETAHRVEYAAGWRLSVRIGSRWYHNDYFLMGFHTYDRDGWGRCAVEVPAGTVATDVREIKISAVGLAWPKVSRVLSLSAWMLDRNYTPRKPFFRLASPETFRWNRLSARVRLYQP